MAFSDRPSSRGRPAPAPNRPAHPGKHAKSHHSIWILVAPAVAVLAVLVGLGVFLARQSSQPLSPPTQTAAHAAQVRAGRDAAASKAVAACQQAWAAQSPALQAADRSLAQWQTHVQAMNALVAGRISFAQASRFWARTRIGAKHRVRVFERSYAPVRRAARSCVMPDGTPGRGAAATVHACAKGIGVRSQTLATAQRAIRTWRRHIRAMEMLRTGQLSPSRATRMWLKVWHRGQRQLDDYHSQASQAAAQHC